MNRNTEFFEHILDVEGKLLLWVLNHETRDKRSLWFDNTSEILSAVERLDKYHVYFATGSRKEDLGPDLRGGRAECFQYRSLWLDLDVLGENHASDRLPPSIEAARTLLDKMPLSPSCVVSSGGGLQAYWCLSEAIDATELEPFLRVWGTTWKTFGAELGWHVDNVFDLSRVMRAPGSVNHKNDARVEVLSANWAHQYNLSDFDPYLRELELKSEVAPRAPGVLERPGDAYNRVHSVDPIGHAKTILEDYGFTPLPPKANGEFPYTRPGKYTGDSSATIYPDGHTTIYSDDPSLPTSKLGLTGEPLTPYALYAVFVHEDWHTAASTLKGQGYGDPLIETDEYKDAMWLLEDVLPKPLILEEPIPPSQHWEMISLFDVDGETPEDPPSVGCRTDGVFLLYKGKVHTIYGEPGGLKSWFTQVIIKQIVENGERALIIDFENSRRSVFDRFKYLGLTGDDFRLIDIIKPDTPFAPEDRLLIQQASMDKHYELIVVDGTTDAMVLFGLDPAKTPDAAKFDRGFLKPLADTGAAVIYVDHVTKDHETRGSWGFGSQHKKSAIDGASFAVEMISSFGKGMNGRAKIVIHKDKPGDLLQHALEGVHSTMVELDMSSDPATFNIVARLQPPSVWDNPNFRPTIMMGKIAEYIEANPGLSKDVIITGSGVGGGKKDWIALAFQKLEAEGFIAADLDGGRDRRWRTVKHYDEFQDGLDNNRNHDSRTLTPGEEKSLESLRKTTQRLFPEDLLPDNEDVKTAPTDFFYTEADSPLSDHKIEARRFDADL